MPNMKIDAISVTSNDMARSVKFYSLLGFEFPKFEPGEDHVEPITKEGDVRLMIDEAKFMKSMTGVSPKPPTHSSFAIKCETAAEVDQCAARVKAAGFNVVKEPWDAFWGQRYAILADPDGYQIDVFAWV
jgi:uncharacterized glyoxalase superfamily protein PhnB